MRVFGLRHGESLANVEGIVLSDPARGCAGFGLTARGRAQVRAAVAAAALPAPVQVVSSDFLRARESAEEAAAALGGAPVELARELRERWFGAWEGTSNVNYTRVWERDALDPEHTEQGVESVTSVLARALALVRRLTAEPRAGSLLLVSHGDTLQILETGLLGLDPRTHRARVPWVNAELRALGPPSGSPGAALP